MRPLTTTAGLGPAILLLLALPLLLAGAAAAKPKSKPAPAPGWYVILGKTQLFDGAKAFPAFCRKRASEKRSKLRREVIAQLKSIARSEQPKIGKALKLGTGARSLWIVNAIVAQLDVDQIKRARKSRLVKWIYPTTAPTTAGAPGRVGMVLERRQRAPFTTKGKRITWNVEKLRAPKVWKDLGVTGEGVVVVSFDHGMNYRHEDLRGNVWINEGEIANNGRDDDGNGLVDDLYGFDFARMRCEVMPLQPGRPHGSWTSCLVIGDGSGGTITGVAPRARLMPVIGMGAPYPAGQVFEYALTMGGDIVSMSFSIPNLGDTRGLWRLMAEQATAAGLVLISGAGNFRGKVKVPVQIRIPEGIPCVISVGGVTKKLKLSPISSIGPVEWKSVRFYGDHPMPRGLIKPDIVAFPGPKIGLVSREDTGYLDENNGRQGNSLSAPQVAGICALMLSADPELLPWRVKKVLEETARDLKPRGKDPETGRGLVDAYRAVKAVRGK